MSELYVRASITIDAPAERVWAVLTSPELNGRWSDLFGATGPIGTDWSPGSRVRWRNASGVVYVEGRVLAFEPSQRLEFSARSTDIAMHPVSGLTADDIVHAYRLSADRGRTTLAITHGDFAKLPNGDALFRGASGLWDRVLARQKQLAEQHAPSR